MSATASLCSDSGIAWLLRKSGAGLRPSPLDYVARKPPSGRRQTRASVLIPVDVPAQAPTEGAVEVRQRQLLLQVPRRLLPPVLLHVLRLASVVARPLRRREADLRLHEPARRRVLGGRLLVVVGR